jgi:hypothetical protein
MIEAAFKPLGNITVQELFEKQDVGGVGAVSGYLKREHLRHLGYKLLDHAETLITPKVPVLKQHFYWSARGGFYYRWRDLDDFALDGAIHSYGQQIAMATKAAREFRKQYDDLPGHAGFSQMRIIEEKRGNFEAAKELCHVAQAQGWAGSWEKSIARIDKKVAKVGSPLR